MNEGRPAGSGRKGKATPGAGKGGRGERKAVLNVTVGESLAGLVRKVAARENTTVSSVVEQALAQQLAWELRRQEGLAAIEEYYREHGRPAAEETAAAKAWVDEAERLLREAEAGSVPARDEPGSAAGGGRGAA